MSDTRFTRLPAEAKLARAGKRVRCPSCSKVRRRQYPGDDFCSDKCRSQPRKRDTPGYVYFARSEHGPFKVGFTRSRAPELYVTSKKAWHPGRLDFVAAVWSTQETEQAIHGLLATSATHGGGTEWFHGTDILYHLMTVASGCGDLCSTVQALSEQNPV